MGYIKIVNKRGQSITLNPSFRVEGLPLSVKKEEIEIDQREGVYTPPETVKLEPRTIRISGYYYANSKEEAEAQRQAFLNIVKHKEKVRIYPDDAVERYIEAYFVADGHSYVEGTGRKVAGLYLEFKADEPYIWGEEVAEEIGIFTSLDNGDDHDKGSECLSSPYHTPDSCPMLSIVGNWNIIKNPQYYNNIALSNNLIVDGDFEQTSLTENWNYASTSNWNYTTAVATRDSTYKKNLSYSVKCGNGSTTGIGIAEKVKHKVIPNTVYNLNFYVYSTNSASQYIVCFRLFDKNGNDITSQKYVSGFNYSSYYAAHYIGEAVPSGSWVNKNFTIRIPLDVYYIQFAFMYYRGGDGYVWFDRISFTPISNANYITFSFQGEGITVVGEKSFDSGKIFYTVDGGEEKEVDLYSSWKIDTLFTVAGLTPGSHTLKIRTSDSKNSSSNGYNIAINTFIPITNNVFINNIGTIKAEPVIYIEPVEKVVSLDFKGKVSGSTTENKNILKARTGASSVAPSDASWTEASDYSNLAMSDEAGVKTSTTTNSHYPYQLFIFDLSGISTDVNVVKNNLTEITYYWRGRAKGQNTGERNSALHYIWNGSSWVSLPASGQEMSNIDFTRGSDAYKIDGSKETGNNPRFEPGRFYNWLTKNQSDVETDTTGFSAVGTGVTITRDTTDSWEGQACLKVVCSGAAAGQGFETTKRDVIPSRTYTASVYLKGSGTVYLKIREYKADGTFIGETSSPSITLTSTWTRYSVSRSFTNQGAQVNLQVVTTSAQAITFYADALAIHEGDTALEWRAGGTGKQLWIEASATNLFDNSGFESGSLSGWTVNAGGGNGTAVVTNAAGKYYSGSYGVEVAGGTNGVILYQSKGSSGNYYSVSFYVKASDLAAIDNTIVKAYINGAEADFDIIEPLYRGWYRCIKNNVSWSSSSWGIKVLAGKTVYMDNAMMVVESSFSYSLPLYIETTKNADNLQILIGQFLDFSKPFTIKFWKKSLQLPPSDYSYLWFYTSTNAPALYVGVYGSTPRLAFWNEAGNLQVYNGTALSAPWDFHYFKLVYDGTYFKLFVDNTEHIRVNVGSNFRKPYKLYITPYQLYGISHLQLLNVADTSTEDLTKPPSVGSNTVFYADFEDTLDYYCPFQATLTSSLSQYVQSDNKIYVMVRPQAPSDGTNASEIETDYVRLDVKHKYAKNIAIIRRGKNLLTNTKPKGVHYQLVAEWNYKTGLSGAYDNVYDAKEEAIYVRNWSGSHHGYGQKVVLQPGRTYTFSFECKANNPVRVCAWVFKPDFSGMLPRGVSEMSSIFSPSSNSYTRYTFTFTAKYSHYVISLLNNTTTAGSSWWKNLQLEEGNSSSEYEEPVLQIVRLGSSGAEIELKGTDLIYVDCENMLAEENNSNILGYLNDEFLLHSFQLAPGVNNIYCTGSGAYKITLKYRSKYV